ncbi:MAG: VacJ family lipoprotein [Nitrospirales bacterium]|nr:VacJ family lipoprotein [Nitrospirales bacterium]
MSTGCATTGSSQDPHDSLESINRPLHNFNDYIDDKLMEPVVHTYIEYTPKPVRGGVSNFFDNIGEINVLLNNFLQGKGKQGLSDTGRFLVNSTVGVLGIFDVATSLGLEKHDEDFGQTLGVWGSEEGPYLTLPFYGPTTTRGIPDLAVSTLTNPIFYLNLPILAAGVTFAAPMMALSMIDKRARLDKGIHFRDEVALDTYVFTREAYLQRRQYLVYDGDPPQEEFLAEAEDLLDELEVEEELVPSPDGAQSQPNVQSTTTTIPSLSGQKVASSHE